ncbi:MAG: nucleotidyltransferase family protein [Deltaproteobacteria bacterium]|nr:nucleotidyltransferase family protein [Deltaproteobacteria bacterium]
MQRPPSRARFEAIAKETWLLDTGRRASDALAAAGVASVLIKGCALAGWLHRPGARPMADCDVLVARRDRDRAARALRDAGYLRVPRPHSPTGMRWHPTLDFSAPNGALLDLHVGVGAWPRFQVDVAGILARSVPAEAVGGTARRPCLADLIWLHSLDVAKDDGRCKPTADLDLRALAAAASHRDWQHAAECAHVAGCAATLWTRLLTLDEAAPAVAEVAMLLRPSTPRRWAIEALATTPRTGALGRLAAGWAHTDSTARYGAAATFFAARSLLDYALRAADR